MNTLLNNILATQHLEYIILDDKLNILEFSSGISKLADNSHEVMPGKDVRLGFPELIGIEDILIAVRQGHQTNFELKGISRFTDNNSLYLDINIIAYPVGFINRLFILFEDVTEKMLLEQKLVQISNESNLLLSYLAASKDYINKIITSMADALIVTTASGKIKTVNTSAQKLFGYREEELINQPLSIIINDNKLLLQLTNLQDLGEGEVLQDIEVFCQTKTGDKVVIAFSCAVIQTDIEDLQNFVYIGRNIAERKRAEEELIKALEKEKKLRELKSRFISIASHEFRTPLTTILAASELLKNFSHKLSDRKKQERLNKIQAEVKTMTTLLDDVLIIGKVEAGRIEFKPAPLNLEEFCLAILEETKLNDGNAHNFIFNIQGDNTNTTEMDKKLLGQILNNLLSNAVKYSPTGSTIYFDIVFEDEQVIFQVKDEGIGIPENHIQYLFETFYRANNVGEISGTGLGMSIIKSAVELHGGKIVVDSTLGVGTTCTIYIPRRREEGGERREV